MLRTKFFGSGPIKIPSGTTGFWTVQATVNTKTYNFGSGAVAASTSLPLAIASGSGGISIPSYTLVSRGNGSLVNTYKYSYPSTTVSSGANLSHASGWCTSAGNDVLGMLAISSSVAPNIACKYTYSGDVVTLATSFSWGNNGSFGKQGFGSNTKGYFTSVTSVAATPINIYTYSSDVVTTSGYIPNGLNSMSTAGTATFAIILLGSSSTNVKKYTYATDSAAAATSLPVTGGNTTHHSGAGNDTIGVFPGGAINGVSSIYTYSNDTTNDSTAFGVTVGASNACGSNGVTGVNA